MNNLLKTTLNNKFKIYYLEDDKYVGGQIASASEYESFETKVVLDHINQGDTVIDIGANIGYYTLLFADKVGKNGKVYAFEPDPVNFSILEKNIKENSFENVILKNMAVSNNIDSLYLFLSEENYGDHRLYSHGSVRNKVKVECDSLDNLFTNFLGELCPVQLIKTDTQGFEPFVIEGSKDLIKKFHPAIFLEYWPYGFQNAGINEVNMLDFFQKEYGDIHFIDEINESTYKTNKAFIDNYCKQLNGYFHCNIYYK